MDRRERALRLCLLLALALALTLTGIWPACAQAQRTGSVDIGHLGGDMKAAGAGKHAGAKGKGHEGMLRSGTAFFVTQSGDMLTSAHVVRGCQRINVWPRDMASMPASLVAIDDQLDVALLATNRAVKMAARPLAVSVHQGMSVYTIGFGLTPSSPLVPVMTRGDVRGTAQPRGHRLLVLRAALHEGNSGGPVVDAQGALLGMIVGRYTDNPELSVAVCAQDLARFVDARPGAPAPVVPQAPEMKPGARLRQISALVQCLE
ncbi:serine protease [Cupriavidus sp. 2TAF22]|uniref:S1 family peptidase n=1 Tax=unclassified Cupriavidus TaxID=2640874 RepID=UPI003F8EAB90